MKSLGTLYRGKVVQQKTRCLPCSKTILITACIPEVLFLLLTEGILEEKKMDTSSTRDQYIKYIAHRDVESRNSLNTKIHCARSKIKIRLHYAPCRCEKAMLEKHTK